MAAPPVAPPGPIDRLFFRLFGFDPSQPDVVKWVVFAKRLLAVFAFSIAALWAVLTYNSITGAQALLEDALASKGQALVGAAARTAFVPLSLGDEEALKRVLTFYEGDPDLAFLEIAEAGTGLGLRRDRPAAKGRGRILVMEAPVALPGEYADPAYPPAQAAGLARAGLSTERLDRRMRIVAWRNAAAGAVLLLAILAAGVFLIRGMTRRLRDLVGEARMAEALRRSNQELEQFAFAASHDLQAPLRTVSSYVQLLQQRYQQKLDPEANRLIDTAVGGVKRMAALIQDLLQYSKVGRTQAVRRPASLDAVLEVGLASLQTAISESGAVIDRQPLPTLSVNPGLIAQLFQNLIGNAIKYRGAQPPRLRVWAQREAEDWVISISDNGIGIDPKYFDKIFVIFQRLHTRGEYPGTGIGLAICKKIVELHEGRIWVESAPGQGATFRFSIPAKGGPAIAQTASQSA